MNLILTSTTGGLEAKAIEPFFRSLRLSGCQDPVVVFASKISDASRELMAKYQATVIDFEYQGMPVLSRLMPRLRWASKIIWKYYFRPRAGRPAQSYLLINNGRYFYWQDYLLGLKEKPAYVLMTDIRDVVFQQNPFAYPFQPGLSVSPEADPIARSRGAIKGLTLSIGPREMWRLRRHEIINCGTIVADYDTSLKYLDLLNSRFKRSFFWALFDGIDQPLHTYIVHRQLIRPVHNRVNWQSPFLTMSGLSAASARKNSEGYLCNEDGSVIPIVHQYDRVKGLYQRGGAVPPCWELCASTGS